MAIRLRRVEPREVREAAVQFFLKTRAWPWTTEADYYRYWDWRYSTISESRPASVWIATDGETILGHLAVNFRTLQLDGREVRVGLPGNFLVDEQHRKMMIGPLLARIPIQMVRQGEIDLFLGYGNATAHSMSLAFGAKDIGPMSFYVDVRQWGPVLSRHIPLGRFLAPAASVAACLRKTIVRRGRLHHVSGLEVRELTAQEILTLDRSRWKQPGGLVWRGSGEYLARRFLGNPFRDYRIHGIIHGSSGRLEGFLVTEGASRLNVILCETNEAVLLAVDAVDLLASSARQVEVVVVPVLQQTMVGTEFSQRGYLARSGQKTDPAVQRTFWSAYWLPQHSLASFFGRTECWKLWYGWNQY
ncbi:MAG: hypothetical protein ACREUT_08160 [Steroidobacteraceae bacterium]